MRCPKCGDHVAGTEMAPGFTRCNACDNEFQVNGLATENFPSCACGTFAVGRCQKCRQFVCGDHSAVFSDARLCAEHYQLQIAEVTPTASRPSTAVASHPPTVSELLEVSATSADDAQSELARRNQSHAEAAEQREALAQREAQEFDELMAGCEVLLATTKRAVTLLKRHRKDAVRVACNSDSGRKLKAKIMWPLTDVTTSTYGEGVHHEWLGLEDNGLLWQVSARDRLSYEGSYVHENAYLTFLPYSSESPYHVRRNLDELRWVAPRVAQGIAVLCAKYGLTWT